MLVSGRDAALQCALGTGVTGGSELAEEAPPGTSRRAPPATSATVRRRRQTAARLGLAGDIAVLPVRGTTRTLSQDRDQGHPSGSTPNSTDSALPRPVRYRFRRQSAAILRAMTVAIRLTGLRKQFGDVTAVDSLDLEILDGEFFSMLGPS